MPHLHCKTHLHFSCSCFFSISMSFCWSRTCFIISSSSLLESRSELHVGAISLKISLALLFVASTLEKANFFLSVLDLLMLAIFFTLFSSLGFLTGLSTSSVVESTSVSACLSSSSLVISKLMSESHTLFKCLQSSVQRCTISTRSARSNGRAS